jgi:hypothetical protein
VTAIGAGRAGAKAAGDFLRYVQYRDNHLDGPPRDVDDALRYVAHRDRSSGRGLLFGPEGTAHDVDRRDLTAYIGRSIKGVPPPEGRPPYSDRACYRFVISPADARGLDLQALTRAAMDSLAKDLGPSANLPPWIAAEHRNTNHPHVHVVLAARRQAGPGRYRAVAITKARLVHINQAVTREIVRQRGDRVRLDEVRSGHLGRPCRGMRGSRLGSHLERLARSQAVAAQKAVREYEREAERERERGFDEEVSRAHRR